MSVPKQSQMSDFSRSTSINFGYDINIMHIHDLSRTWLIKHVINCSFVTYCLYKDLR